MLMLQSKPEIAADMIETLNGDVLPNTGRSHLIAKLQEAFALDGAVTMTVDGGTPATVPLTLAEAKNLKLGTLGGVDLRENTCTGIEKLGGDDYLLTYADGTPARRMLLSCSDYWNMPA